MRVVRSRAVNAESTDHRYGELARAVLILLNDAPDGLPIQDVLDQVAVSVPPTALESEDRRTVDAGSAYEKSIRRSSMELAKAGWLTKSTGTWRITDAGRSALGEFSEPGAFYRAAVGRRDPSVTPATPETVGDIFAGCFLSIAGSLVGAVIGTLVLFVNMLPNPSPSLFVGFAGALVVGFVLSFFANFGIAGIAGRSGHHAENIWVVGTALVAVISAALTPSILIAVDTAGE